MQDLNETKNKVTKQTLDFDGPPMKRHSICGWVNIAFQWFK